MTTSPVPAPRDAIDALTQAENVRHRRGRRAEEHDDLLAGVERRRAHDQASVPAEPTARHSKADRAAEVAFQPRIGAQCHDCFDRSMIGGRPPAVDRDDRAACDRIGAARQIAEVGRQEDGCAGARGGQQQQNQDGHGSHGRNHLQNGLGRAAAGAGSAEALAHAGEAFAHLRGAAAVGQHRDRFVGHRVGRELRPESARARSVRRQSGSPWRTCPPSRAACRASRSAATAGRRRPSACRAAPSAPSRCPTPSAPRPPTRARHRSPLRRSRRQRQPSRDVEQMVVEVRRASDEELRARARAHG